MDQSTKNNGHRLTVSVVTLFGFFSNRVYEDLKLLFIIKMLLNNE